MRHPGCSSDSIESHLVDEFEALSASKPMRRGRTALWSEVDAGLFSLFHAYGPSLPSATYRCVFRQDRGVCLQRLDTRSDEPVPLADGITNEPIEEVKRFWSAKGKFYKHGLLHKRGFLLVGPAGCGKTTLVNRICDYVLDNLGGLALLVMQPRLAEFALAALRQVEPERPVVGIVEDIDALMDEDEEEALLALLDGKRQIEHILWIATTNFPERLDARLTARPSRFDRVQVIPPASVSARREYVQQRAPELTTDELEQWVSLSDGFSIAHLKELIVAVRCLDQDLAAAATRLRKNLETKPTSAQWKIRGIGFSNGE